VRWRVRGSPDGPLLIPHALDPGEVARPGRPVQGWPGPAAQAIQFRAVSSTNQRPSQKERLTSTIRTMPTADHHVSPPSGGRGPANGGAIGETVRWSMPTTSRCGLHPRRGLHAQAGTESIRCADGTVTRGAGVAGEPYRPVTLEDAGPSHPFKPRRLLCHSADSLLAGGRVHLALVPSGKERVMAGAEWAAWAGEPVRDGGR